MRRRLHRERVRIANLSADWGETWGALARRPGEQRAEHLIRLSTDPGYSWCDGTMCTLMTYANAMRQGAVFPPVFVIRAPRGDLLIDGTHRAKAAAFSGKVELDAMVLYARSEADAGRVADAFWKGEFADGDYPSDRPDWGSATHIDLGTRTRGVGGVEAHAARRQKNIGRCMAATKPPAALVTVRTVTGHTTRLRRYEATPRRSPRCTHDGVYQQGVTPENVERYRAAGAVQDARQRPPRGNLR